MPIVLNVNLHTGQGLTNGAYGTITRIVLDPVDVERFGEDPFTPEFLCKKPPLAVFVKMREPHPDRLQLEGLDIDEIPIKPLKGAASWSVGPKGKSVTKSFPFTQIPISAAFAVTDYRSQGATEKTVIVDLEPAPKQKDTRAAAYVAASRVTGLNGLAVLRKFNKEVYTAGLPGELTREFAREKEAEQRTISWLRQVRLGQVDSKGRRFWRSPFPPTSSPPTA